MNARRGRDSLTPSLFKTLSSRMSGFDVIFPARHYWGFLYGDPISAGLDTVPTLINDVEEPREYVIIGCLVDLNIRDLNEHIFVQRRGGSIEKDNTLYLNFKLADDTDLVNCQVDRYKYEAFGREIAEKGVVGKTWYLARGRIINEWRRIQISEILNLNCYYPSIMPV